MINYQCSCNSWKFSLFLMNCFPIFLFNCQFQLFLRRFVLEMGKNFSASRHMKGAMKIFTGVGKKKQGENWHVFLRRGKIGTFGQNIYTWCSLLKSLFFFTQGIHLTFSLSFDHKVTSSLTSSFGNKRNMINHICDEICCKKHQQSCKRKSKQCCEVSSRLNTSITETV